MIIDFVNNEFLLTFEYSKEAVESIKKTLKSRKFNGLTKSWSAPHSEAERIKLLTAFKLTERAKQAIANVPKQKGDRLYQKDGRLWFDFAYNKSAIESIKGISGRKAHPIGNKWYWSVPLDKGNEAIQIANFYGFKIEDVEEAIEQEEKLVKANLKANKTETAVRVEVDGLNGELMPFQHITVDYMRRNNACLLGDDMGLGKTIQTIAVIQDQKLFPIIIVCPATLKLNWRNEIWKWAEDGLRVNVISGSEMFGTADIHIINYDILHKHLEQLSSIKPQMIVLDEGHYIKSKKAKRTKACMKLSKLKSVKKVMNLTGTPILSRPVELWSQLEFLGVGERFGGFWQYANRYCNARKTRFGWDFNGAGNTMELNELLRKYCMVRRTKKEVLTELPDKRRIVVPLEITNRSEYERACDDIIAWLGSDWKKGIADKAIDNPDFQKELAKAPPAKRQSIIRGERIAAVQRAMNSEALIRIGKLKKLAAEGKLKSVFAWIDDLLASKDKVIIFAYHKEIVLAIKEKYQALVIMGDTQNADRQTAVEQFQDNPNRKVIVGNLDAMGVGVTLTAASDVVFVEYGWTPAIHEQAEDRANRIGQKNAVSCWYLQAEETIEEGIHNLVFEEKMTITKNVIDGGSGKKRSGGIAKKLLKEFGKK